MKYILFITILFTTVLAFGQNKSEEQKIKSFLISKPQTYGWETKSNDISLDFFKDGRLHIQGPDGESTMWEGSWKVIGDKLTMRRPDLEKTITVKIIMNGEKLMLDSLVYTRSKP